MLLGAGILAFLGIVFADVIVGTLGLDNETKALTVRLMRIMFPMIIFTGTAYTLTRCDAVKGRVSSSGDDLRALQCCRHYLFFVF